MSVDKTVTEWRSGGVANKHSKTNNYYQQQGEQKINRNNIDAPSSIYGTVKCVTDDDLRHY